jgi:molecular chaperone DnaK
MESGGRAEIDAAAQELTKASHQLAEALYRQASAGTPGAGAPPPPGEGGSDGDVIDAEVVDKK